MRAFAWLCIVAGIGLAIAAFVIAAKKPMIQPVAESGRRLLCDCGWNGFVNDGETEGSLKRRNDALKHPMLTSRGSRAIGQARRHTPR